jgi:hypothetical protein
MVWSDVATAPRVLLSATVHRGSDPCMISSHAVGKTVHVEEHIPPRSLQRREQMTCLMSRTMHIRLLRRPQKDEPQLRCWTPQGGSVKYRKKGTLYMYALRNCSAICTIAGHFSKHENLLEVAHARISPSMLLVESYGSRGPASTCPSTKQ